jgi:hypothetical protein
VIRELSKPVICIILNKNTENKLSFDVQVAQCTQAEEMEVEQCNTDTQRLLNSIYINRRKYMQQNLPDKMMTEKIGELYAKYYTHI